MTDLRKLGEIASYREYQLSNAARGPRDGVYVRIAEARRADIKKLTAEITAAGAVEVVEFPGIYVSPSGDIFSTAGGRFIALRPGIKPGGYEFVGIGSRGNRKYKMVHRLVAEAFIPNPYCLSEVNHKDGNKRNNAIENLEWATRSQNAAHAFSIGLMKRGLESPNSKLSADQVRAIRSMHGKYRDIGAIFGVSAQTVCNIKRRSKYADVE